MNANVTFRHMDSSASLRAYATEKLERVCDKYVRGNVDAAIVLSVERFWHIVDFTLQIKNLTIKASERTEDMYSSIDLALDKIEKQLRRHKDRLRDHKPTPGESRSFKMGVLSVAGAEEENELEEDFSDDFKLYPAPTESAEAPAETTAQPAAAESVAAGGVTVLRNQTFAARPMSLEEAVLQLNLLEDRQFFVFTNAETSAINVVYKRNDNNIGLIET